jgi:hypothetical protein
LINALIQQEKEGQCKAAANQMLSRVKTGFRKAAQISQAELMLILSKRKVGSQQSEDPDFHHDKQINQFIKRPVVH